MPELSIGEVARLTGLSPSALRFYEAEGLVVPIRRAGGRRQYDPAVIGILKVLQFAQKVGFSLADIRVLFRAEENGTTPSSTWSALAEHKLRQLDEVIARAEKMKSAIKSGKNCGCVTLADCRLPEIDAVTHLEARDGSKRRGISNSA